MVGRSGGELLVTKFINKKNRISKKLEALETASLQQTND